MPDVAPLLSVKGIKKRFGAVHALRGVNFDVAPGEVVALLGDNGAGKSTLVKILAGNQSYDEGELIFDGKTVNFSNPTDAKAVGIETVYQDLSLCPNVDVVANFFMGREICKNVLGINILDKKEMTRRTKEALSDIASAIPDITQTVEHMSGGQRQAIELSRFIYFGGKLVILDEPFAALGVEQTRRGLELIERARAKGISIIIITHNMMHAFQVADRVVVLRQGVVAGNYDTRDTTPEEVIGMITGEFAKQAGMEALA
ncbi:MAG: ABC transporter ATP-binding protein [Hyphomicrobiales bacterium]|nr:MAG: ABC transporter ATP-binding protein [Hyphomicrobiales bacterium]